MLSSRMTYAIPKARINYETFNIRLGNLFWYLIFEGQISIRCCLTNFDISSLSLIWPSYLLPIEFMFPAETEVKQEASLILIVCSEGNVTWPITSDLADHSARKALFSCSVYTNETQDNTKCDSHETFILI